MEAWRARGYVQDSDEDEDSHDSILVNLAVSREAVNISNTGAFEDGKPHHVGANSSQKVGSGSQDDSGQQRINTADAEKDYSNTAALLVQHETVKQDEDGQEGTITEVIDDLDELQQDFDRFASTAPPEARLWKGIHDQVTEPCSSPITPHSVSFPSSLAPSSTPKSLSNDYRQSPTLGIQKTTRRHQSDGRKSFTDGDPKALDSISRRSTTNEIEPLVVNEGHGPQRAARSLRHRNPIQLHPYALESEQYRKILKARGVKPLRIAQMDAEAAQIREQDSQDTTFNGEESQHMDSDAEQPLTSSPPPLRPEYSSAALSHEKEDVFVFGGDDLPDMNTILHHSTLTYAGNGHKRRKITKMKSKAFQKPRGPDLYQRKSLSEDQIISVLVHDDVPLDIPPSPPHSDRQTPSETHHSVVPTFRMPQKLSSCALPTPITSSEPRRPHVLEISEDEEADNQSQRTADTTASTDAESSAPEEETSHQLQRAQRRIRGVLPASWLKLDLKTQAKKPANIRKPSASISPERASPQRGVARVVFAPGSQNRDSANPRHSIDLLSENENSESEIDELPRHTPVHQHQHHIFEQSEERFFDDRWGEAAEDDQIDAMLPSAKRAFRPRNSNNPQTKLTDHHSHPRPNKTSSHATYQPRIEDHFMRNRKRKPKFRPPRLGIVDASLSEESPHGSVPKFLKLASRTAQSRHDKGRQSPSRKFVHLATRVDNEDANETLRNWREGTILPSSKAQTHGTSSRQPLFPRSANSQLPTKASETERILKENKSLTSRGASMKSSIRPAKPRKLQTFLDRMVERRHGVRHVPAQLLVPMGPQQAVEKPTLRGQVVSSLGASKESRPATLESARDDANQTRAQAMFRRGLDSVNHFNDDSGLPGVVVRRFFSEGSAQPLNSTTSQLDHMASGKHVKEVSNTTRSLLHKRRKRQPRRVNVHEIGASEPGIVLDDDLDQPMVYSEVQRKDKLIGLRPFGTRYSVTFDVTPLPTGTCFHTNSLLGSGALVEALKHRVTATLDHSRGYGLLTFNERILRWGPWNDTVSSELGEVFEAIGQWVQTTAGHNHGLLKLQTYDQVVLLQASILDYFSHHLSFLDPVDRVACVLRCNGLLSTLASELVDHNAVNKTSEQIPEHLPKDVQISILTLSIINQLHKISKHDLIPLQLQDDARSLVQRVSRQTLDLSLTNGIEPFRTCLSKLRSESADYRIQDDFVEAFVVVHHVLDHDQEFKTSVWQTLLKSIPTKSSDDAFDVPLAEEVWKQLFTLLPFLELDSNGVVETGRRFKVSFDNWTLAKRLISPLLEAALNDPQGQHPSFNIYCRAVFGRCLHLINDWGWRRCESIIGILFDYFARNGLAHLKNEVSKGSPPFLDRLDKNPALVFEPEDRAFHILLKIIGSGLRHMRQSCPEKKIRDVVWRLMPNHGRSHPKEEAIRQEHLDALRNHHDLLCILYWAAPPSCRPRLTVIRNLVHLETSHREACHINIRAWFNLVRFQLSTDESTNDLEQFADWHHHLLTQILQQHSLARTELEEQANTAQSVNGLIVSKGYLETTIARNQRRVEAILNDALVCLKLAIDMAQDAKAASVLLSTALTRVFELFDASKIRPNQPIGQALDVLAACASKFMGPRDENEDSQDYGDWSAFDDESSTIPPIAEFVSLFKVFHEPLRHLLSNCFGADLAPSDALLLKVVDVWIVVAQVLVRNGLKSWADYLDRFGTDSWSSLRDTEQTRKYSVYYLSALIEKDKKIYREHEAFFLTSWVCSLVERESLLKFQHRLTSALLNIDSENALLQNLPFWKDGANGHYQITPSDSSDRTLSLISSVLSNMRVSLDSTVFQPSVGGNELRQEFRDLLKHLMATMKRNYQELGNGSNIKGAYVDFVHRVIEFLQQHTSTICPIDRFFTDNSTFPLPATDPTYVVGQLKNYALRLHDAKTPKQLVVFLQSVSERAAVDGQQPYLVGQLHAAMSDVFEDGVSSTPTLRSLVIRNIVPAYVEMAFSTTCGWILAMPYLQALQKVFGGLLKDLDGANTGSVAAFTSTLAPFLNSIRQSLELLISSSDDPLRLNDARTLQVVSAVYAALSALLPVIDYIVRLQPESTPFPAIADNIAFFKSLTLSFSAVLLGRGDSDLDILLPLLPTHPIDRSRRTEEESSSSFSDIRKFTTQELKDTLVRNWSCHNDRYYVTRASSTRREVVVDVPLFEEVKAGVVDVFGEFERVLGLMPAFGDDDYDDEGDGDGEGVFVRKRRGKEELVRVGGGGVVCSLTHGMGRVFF